MTRRLRAAVLGLGRYGRLGAKALIDRGFFSEVVVGDVRVELAKQLAAEMDNETVRVFGRYANAEDHRSLLQFLEGASVLCSFVGPFEKYGYGFNPAKAAIEAGVNYVDINDAVDETQRVLALDKEARDVGVTIITGLGLSPGVSSIFARLGTDKLDEVHKIHIYFLGGSDPVISSTACRHLMASWRQEQVQIYRDGKLLKVQALSEMETLQLPELTSEAIEAYLFEHPEVVTLPHYLKGVKEVIVRGGWAPNWFAHRFRNLSDYGLDSDEPIEVAGMSVVPADFTAAFLASDVARKIHVRKLKEIEIDPADCGLWVTVRVDGRKSGKFLRYIYRLGDTKRLSIVMPTVIGSELLAAGEIRVRGAIPAEAIPDPKRILDRIADIGISWQEIAEEGN